MQKKKGIYRNHANFASLISSLHNTCLEALECGLCGSYLPPLMPQPPCSLLCASLTRDDRLRWDDTTSSVPVYVRVRPVCRAFVSVWTPGRRSCLWRYICMSSARLSAAAFYFWALLKQNASWEKVQVQPSGYDSKSQFSFSLFLLSISHSGLLARTTRLLRNWNIGE